MKKIIVINGPNLNLLGKREASFYGNETLEAIEKRLRKTATDRGAELECFQSNHEGEILDYIHGLIKGGLGDKDAKKSPTGIIINAGALTHTSIAIRDALSVSPIPFIEVHISNVYQRDTFRHHSYLSDIASGVIVGLGSQGYDLALAYFLDH